MVQLTPTTAFKHMHEGVLVPKIFFYKMTAIYENLDKFSNISFDIFNLLKTRNPNVGTFANSEDPDEMPHDVAFHQGLHFLLRQKQSSEKEIQYFLEIITCDPFIYTMYTCLDKQKFSAENCKYFLNHDF